MIYVSEEETVKAGKSPPERDSRQGSLSRDLGESGPWGLAQAKFRMVQLLASSFYSWEGWVVPLVPSQAGRSPVPSSEQDQDKTSE